MHNNIALQPLTIGSLRLSLGEGPVWDAAANCLYCVDIKGHQVLRIDPETGIFESRDVPRLPSALGLCRSGQLLLACSKGMMFLDFDSGKTELLCDPIAHQPAARLNDGKVAPDGSFWVGSMQNNVADDESAVPVTKSIGGLYRITSQGLVSQLVPENLAISNTFAWSPDGQFFYFADSLSKQLFRASCMGEGLGEQIEVFAGGFDRGVPDGSAMDAQGYLWNARWGGGCVVRFSPDGKVDKVIEIPVANATSCSFGGPDYTTLFVTTAKSKPSAESAKNTALEGAIFSVQTDIPGMKVPIFKN